uniref:Outer dense fiber of sperm tails 2 isoform 1 n=1 Tax=Pan troglodytes TaxID=9598 RepID=G2HIR4_PANTR|nr:outer dense fiber of sperm tails 2 isoform 1 [Pan troglodytes]
MLSSCTCNSPTRIFMSQKLYPLWSPGGAATTKL